MIVAVGSDKGSPGATTLALLLAMVWSGPRVLLEIDPRGADLPFRLSTSAGRPLAASPSVATLAVDARPGAGLRSLELYSQPTALGVPVVAGEVSVRRFLRLAPHLSEIAAACNEWPGTVIADLGPLQPWNPALTMARAATAVVLVVRADTEGLGHLRDRVQELAEDIGGEQRPQTQIGVVVRAEAGDAKSAVTRAERLLTSVGSPSPVLGAFVDDAPGARALWDGQPTRGLTRSRLLATAASIQRRVMAHWPQLSEPTQRADAGGLAPSTFRLQDVR
jgi:hypothetical protein